MKLRGESVRNAVRTQKANANIDFQDLIRIEIHAGLSVNFSEAIFEPRNHYRWGSLQLASLNIRVRSNKHGIPEARWMRVARLHSMRRYVRIMREAPAFPLSLVVALGQCLMWFVPQELWSCVVATLGGAIILVASKKRSGLLVGLLLGSGTVYVNYPLSVPIMSERDVVLNGVVVSAIQRRRPGEANFLFQTDLNGKSYLLRCRTVDLPWRNIYEVQNGDRLMLRGDIEVVKKTTNPLSWQGWLWRQNITGEMRVRFVSKPLFHQYSLRAESREWVQRWAYESFGDKRGVNLVLSMALGYQDVLSPTLESAFKRLGLTHLLVVSGYQVTLLYTVAITLLSKSIVFLPRGLSARRMLGFIGLTLALLYVVFIGGEFSSIRAMVAAACVGGSWIVGRQTGFMQRWGVALLLLEVFWPFCIFDIGVILTFAALWGIGVGAQGVRADSWLAFFRVNLCVWLTTSLVIMLWQGSVSVIGLLINMVLAAPWSIMNCTVGIVALLVAMLPVPGSAVFFQGIIAANQFLSEQVLYWGGKQYSQIILTGYGKFIVSCLLLSSVVCVSIKAYRIKALNT